MAGSLRSRQKPFQAIFRGQGDFVAREFLDNQLVCEDLHMVSARRERMVFTQVPGSIHESARALKQTVRSIHSEVA
jgi:hypothetical protein